jgi:hypothetical protein
MVSDLFLPSDDWRKVGLKWPDLTRLAANHPNENRASVPSESVCCRRAESWTGPTIRKLRLSHFKMLVPAAGHFSALSRKTREKS